MRIKMKTNASGPNGSYSAHRIYKVGSEVPRDTAAEWIEAGCAFECDETGLVTERAIKPKGTEKATRKPSETAKA